MQLRVLGPVEASADHRSLPLGGAKQRSVIAMLGLDANRTVSADRLIEGLWGEDAPPSAAKMVQNYVWRLRSVLGDDSGAEILTRGRGYELRIDPDAVDARRFERLLEAGRAARSGPSTDAAREALALWRGPPLADVADEPFAASQIRRLEELRLEATELAIDADLAVGRHAEVAAEIEGLIAEHPLRERLHGQRMLALYRCGRQAEALEAFRDARRVLVEQIGVEPGPELRRLHDAILRQDAGLEIEAATLELPRALAAAASTPIVGRADALGALRTHWRRTLHHDGALIALVGSEGMGKTRLAAELATIAHGDGATVLYASGTGAPEQTLAVVARASAPVERVLLVVDDADRAGVDVRAAIGRCGDAARARATIVLATGRTAAALAALAAGRSDRTGPAGRRGSARDRGPVRACGRRDRRTGRPHPGREPRRAATRARRRARMGAARGRATRGRRGGPRGCGPCAGTGAGAGADRQRRGHAVHARTLRAPVGAGQRRPGRVSVQGAHELRRRGRGALLRARAARRRARRAARGRSVARGRRTLGQRQVIGGASRAAARAGGRGAAGKRRLDAGADPAGRAAGARVAQTPRPDWMRIGAP